MTYLLPAMEYLFLLSAGALLSWLLCRMHYREQLRRNRNDSYWATIRATLDVRQQCQDALIRYWRMGKNAGKSLAGRGE